MFSVALTAIYMFRLYFLTFHGTFRGTEAQRAHAHESPISMTFPLVVLAIFSVFGGLLNLPGLFLHNQAHWLSTYLNGAPGLGMIHHSESNASLTLMLMFIASAVSIGILIWAYINYVKRGSLAKNDDALTGWEILSNRKLFWDEAYQFAIVKPSENLGSFLKNIVEIKGINAAIFGLANLSVNAGNQIKKLQNGLVSSYLFWMVIGIIMLLVSYLLNTVQWN